MKTWRIAALFLLMLVLTACALQPDQKARILEEGQRQLADGAITRGQFEALEDAVQSGTGWIAETLRIGVPFVASIFGVNWMRNRAREKRGEATGTTKV